MEDTKIKTLHIFENYLPESQNWTFRILNNFEDVDVYVCALEYHNPQFVNSKINLIEIPDYVNCELMVEGGCQNAEGGKLKR